MNNHILLRRINGCINSESNPDLSSAVSPGPLHPGGTLIAFDAGLVNHGKVRRAAKLAVFGVFFIGLLIWVYLINNKYIKHMSELPLNSDDDTIHNENLDNIK